MQHLQVCWAIQLLHRLVLNFYTAKRLLGALHMALRQHENVYGALEVDIDKRVRTGRPVQRSS